jgi:cytosine/adenosine deaminase-related metal-dependent hydrolase
MAGPPIDNGWVSVADGRVIAIGRGRPDAHAAPGGAGVEDLGEVALLPGLVNAHTHLELSELVGRVPPADAMVPWIKSMMGVRGRAPAEPSETAIAAAREAAADLLASGTVLVGDISNTLMTAPLLTGSDGLSGVLFHELIGFNAPDPDVRVSAAWTAVEATPLDGASMSVVAHAPYSVSPAMFKAIAAARRGAPLAVHLGESRAEIEFLRTGRGPFRELLEGFGVWDPKWRAPKCDPVEYLDRLGYLVPGTLVVHGTHLGSDALARLREKQAVLVTCPRSNEWVGEGAPPLEAFYASGVDVAIGTDSLASVGSLRVFDELAAARRAGPGIPARRLIESATIVGARALGRGGEAGSIEAGKRAAFVAVELPANVTDVEEYLVGGVPPDRVRPVRADRPSPEPLT